MKCSMQVIRKNIANTTAGTAINQPCRTHKKFCGLTATGDAGGERIPNVACTSCVMAASTKMVQ